MKLKPEKESYLILEYDCHMRTANILILLFAFVVFSTARVGPYYNTKPDQVALFGALSILLELVLQVFEAVCKLCI